MAYAGVGRLLVRMAPYLTGLAYDIYSATERVDAPDPFTFRRVQVVIQRANSEDVITNTYDILNITSGAPDSSWTSADFTAVEARLATFYGSMNSLMPSSASVREYRWHVLPDTAGDTAAVRVKPVTAALIGSAGNSLPPQVAMTATKQTASRKHWGRVYLGPLRQSVIGTTDTNGRFTSANVDAVAGYFNTLRAGLQADDFPMVVYDRTRGHLATVDSVRVDDVPDIVRSRRPDWVPYRKLLP
jgi:hypothetical protein